MAGPDKRLNTYRPDLAEAALKGKVTAERYAEGQSMQVGVPVLAVFNHPSATAMQLTQALFGEMLRVFDVRDGWAWVKLDADHYVGYVKADALHAEILPSTHEVAVLSTYVYPKPDLKSQPAIALPLLARLRVIGQDGIYLQLASGGYVHGEHVRPLRSGTGDFVAVAERFAFAPYFWGGKTVHGLDCSGLVQVALHAVGRECPRDSDMQELTLGSHLPPTDTENLRRGDLVFWDGHVGIMADRTELLHANGHHMMVAIEPLHQTMARNAAAGKPVTSIRRV